LTWNFNRKGGYSWRFWEGEEDYRWAVLRKNPIFANKFVWFLFNLFFISLYQSYLIMGFTLPIVMTFDQKANPHLNTWDYATAFLFIIFLVIETVADNQQWAFQQEKYRQIKSGKGVKEPYKTGFLRSGLFSVSRHPNYFAEQAIWVTVYLFSVAATGRLINWSFIGSLLLLLLFRGSADFSEGISAEKYPAYKEYQKKTPMFIPKIF
jgi:steroid 5-alpha reductase family enzyme